MGYETVAIAKTANKATASGESSYDASYRRLLLRKSSVLSVSVSVALLRELPALNNHTL